MTRKARVFVFYRPVRGDMRPPLKFRVAGGVGVSAGRVFRIRVIGFELRTCSGAMLANFDDPFLGPDSLQDPGPSAFESGEQMAVAAVSDPYPNKPDGDSWLENQV